MHRIFCAAYITLSVLLPNSSWLEETLYGDCTLLSILYPYWNHGYRNSDLFTLMMDINECCIYSRYTITMDLIFSGSSSFLGKHNMLLRIVGRGSPFSEFLPISSENLSSFHKLLFRFFSSGLCCFLTRNFVYRESGILDQFDEVSVFVILTNNHFLDLIFQNYL